MKQALTYLRILAFPAIIITAWFYYPYADNGPVLCVWRNITGHSCPGCGMTRAICASVHGNFIEAFTYNLIYPVVLALIAWISTSTLIKEIIKAMNHQGIVQMHGREQREIAKTT